MTNTLCFSPLTSLNTTDRQGIVVIISHNYTSTRKAAGWISINGGHGPKNEAFDALKVKAMEDQPSTMPNSILCADCEGTGSKKCTPCKGSGVNSEDHFNGQFKAGALCWLCGGKKEILCGNCNGAGFVGGFMSTGEQ